VTEGTAEKCRLNVPDSRPTEGRRAEANPYDGNPVLEERVLRGARRVIARRLSEIWHEAVHVTLHRDMDLSDVESHRISHGGSMMDYVIRAVTIALEEHPEFNATFDGSCHRLYRNVDLGIAVDSERGLVVPVLRNASTLSLRDLAERRRALVKKAQTWQHTGDEIVGGTFTITNLGVLGADYFTPVINPPQVAILGIGRMRRQAVSWDRAGPVEERILLPASLSIDHRVLDGAHGARFLQSIQAKLKNPSRLQ